MPPDFTTPDDRLFELIQELSKDIKALPNRHEFDALSMEQRRGFDELALKFDKYVLSSEFTTYKELIGKTLENLLSDIEDLQIDEKTRKATRIQFPGFGIALGFLSAIVSTGVSLLLHFWKP
jgi:hypothetical protein